MHQPVASLYSSMPQPPTASEATKPLPTKYGPAQEATKPLPTKYGPAPEVMKPVPTMYGPAPKAPVGRQGYAYGTVTSGYMAAGREHPPAHPRPRDEKPPLLRRRLNIASLVLSLLGPVGLFAFVFWLVGSLVHYNYPQWYAFFLAASAVPILLCGAHVVRNIRRELRQSWQERTWIDFIFGSLLVAWVVAFCFGSLNYTSNLKPYYDVSNLNSYTGVDPNVQVGGQLMDAGMVLFAPGTTLDLRKSMGFQHEGTHCVAPITSGSSEMYTYDFWAVGQNCCTGDAADFQCGEYWDPTANGGLRLVQAEDRTYYRLAVQQAEARHHIQARHPLFFTWTKDPDQIASGWNATGMRNLLIAVIVYFVMQLGAVGAACYYFDQAERKQMDRWKSFAL